MRTYRKSNIQCRWNEKLFEFKNGDSEQRNTKEYDFIVE